MNFATLLTKREECLTKRVRLYNNMTKFSFNFTAFDLSVLSNF